MNHRPPSDDTPNSERYLRDTADSFFFDVSSGVHKPKAYQGETERKKKAHAGPPSWQFGVTTFLSTLTLLAVGIYAYYAALQWCEMKRAADAAKEAADAAKSSALTANTTLKSNQAQFRTEQRPYVWAEPVAAGPLNPQPITVEPLSNGQFRIDLAIRIKNGGRSPAKDMIDAEPEQRIVPMAQLTEQVKKFTPKWRLGNGNIVPPEVSGVVGENWITFDSQQLSKINDQSLVFYVVGAVKYRDIFEPQIPPYETRYCFIYRPIGLQFASCGDGNSIK
jgi:hypothetical protein